MTQIAFCMPLVLHEFSPVAVRKSSCLNFPIFYFRTLGFLTESLVAPGVALVARLALLPLVPRLHPCGSDQFSHFLLGDTPA